MSIKVFDFKAYQKNTLQGFFTLEFGMGLCVKDCTLHEKGSRQWISFPGVPYQKDGVTEWKNILYFQDKEQMNRLQDIVLPMLAELRKPEVPGNVEDDIPF